MFTNDTVRLVVNFRDFSGNPITPSNVILKIYKTDETLTETITNGIISESDKFYYDYVPIQDFIFEFSGIYNDLPVLARQLQKTKFVIKGEC